MVVKVVPTFPKKAVNGIIAKKLAQLDDAIFSRLNRIGIAFVANARSNNTYRDRTKNLRSSIGYVILKNGKQLEADFQGGNSEGIRQAKRLVQSIRKNYLSGWVFIGVAGMEYAAAVESRGLDVITGSSLIAEDQLKDAIKTIQRKLK